MAIFIDSSVFCAYANSRDVHHSKASSIMQEIVSEKYGSGIITDYIFDETMTVALRRTSKGVAVELGNFMLNSEILMAKITPLLFQKAWELFQKPNNFSFTDCTIIAFMNTFGIDKIATFDKEFKSQKNFTIVDS